MNLDHLLSPAEFYGLVLQQSNVALQDQSIEKTAAALGVTTEVATIAKAFYDQLVIDGVKYASAKARADDSVEMAKAFVEHRDTITKQAMSDVDALMTKVAEAVKTAAADLPSLAGMPVSELIAVAALQQESAEQYEASQEKTAQAAVAEPAAKAEGAPAVAPTPGWLSRNAHLAIPAAVIGGGAAYALWKRQQAKEKVRDAEAAAALPVAK